MKSKEYIYKGSGVRNQARSNKGRKRFVERYFCI